MADGENWQWTLAEQGLASEHQQHRGLWPSNVARRPWTMTSLGRRGFSAGRGACSAVSVPALMCDGGCGCGIPWGSRHLHPLGHCMYLALASGEIPTWRCMAMQVISNLWKWPALNQDVQFMAYQSMQIVAVNTAQQRYSRENGKKATSSPVPCSISANYSELASARVNLLKRRK